MSRSADIPKDADVMASIAVGRPVLASDVPKSGLIPWLEAIVGATLTVLAFDRGGSTAAERVMHRIKHRPLRTAISLDVMALKARRDAARLRKVVRALIGQRVCLPEALGVRAGLRALGFDATVVIGYARVELNSPTGFHSWVQFNGHPLGELSEVLSVYEVVKTYGPSSESDG